MIQKAAKKRENLPDSRRRAEKRCGVRTSRNLFLTGRVLGGCRKLVQGSNAHRCNDAGTRISLGSLEDGRASRANTRSKRFRSIDHR